MTHEHKGDTCNVYARAELGKMFVRVRVISYVIP